MYFSLANSFISQKLLPYCDFGYPYPPLSLINIAVPYFFSTTFKDYRQWFQIEMLVLDVLCFLFLYLVLRRNLKINPTITGWALLIYSFLGFFVGHVIYDRLDMAMALTFISFIYFFTQNPRRILPAYFIALVGALTKLLPIFFIPFLMIIEFAGQQTFKDKLRASLNPIFFTLIPFVLIMGIYNNYFCDHLISNLMDHSVRSIQVESTWATPLMLYKVWVAESPVSVGYNFGALHLNSDTFPYFYLWMSKYFGFIILGTYFLFCYKRLKERPISAPPSVKSMCVAIYAILLNLMAFQRVLSPQYFVWLIPGVCILFSFVRQKGVFLVAVISLYALTYVVFDKGYSDLFRFVPKFVYALALRNSLLVFVSLFMMKMSTQLLKNETSETH
jgi:hypothetical protein